MMLALIFGCAKKKGPYHGTEPVAAVPAPTFTATAHDGTPRTRDDLVGSPAVVWFYPKAATAG